jgi:inorganic pyrophosphatase
MVKKAGKNRRHRSLADPTQLGSFEPDDRRLVVVIIETPKGSRNKYAFDPKEGVFALKKVLPAGMAFPYDFGFVPSTRAGDGDPLDVLVLMDEPAFAGCRLSCRLVGVIEGEQEDNGKVERNDRLVAVDICNHSFNHVKHIDDLGKKFERELGEFFVNYHRLSGEKFRLLGLKGPAHARKSVKLCRRRADSKVA